MAYSFISSVAFYVTDEKFLVFLEVLVSVKTSLKHKGLALIMLCYDPSHINKS
jgi:hypothetical protein